MARPKKSADAPETRPVTVRMLSDTVYKLIVIGNPQYQSLTDKVNEACEDLVARYERKNGPIAEEEIEKARAALSKKK
ncbi:MAG: hypothetical protein EOP56_15035 [Sphingobacteriales bacterium]|nr:MAG: hypothetical protein EOP56_15035 [Sphingobacteriales bacterium]